MSLAKPSSAVILPIGVFDSGVGGLTVLDALAHRLPGEDLIYLGDTARVPYGSRSPETVVRYAQRVAGHLVGRGIKALVVACNTATTWATRVLTEAGVESGIPVLGVIEPGVKAALEICANGHVGVIGTEGTVKGGAYARHLHALQPDLRVTSLACPLFVALAEEGWVSGSVARLTAERYLNPLRGGPDTVILGCTHYPLLSDVIAETLPGIHLINSATATASEVARVLSERNLLRDAATIERLWPRRQQFLVTDNVDRFRRVGHAFLGRAPEPVEVVDIVDEDGRRFVPGRVRDRGMSG